MKTYTYEDWWEGKFYLNTCDTFFKAGVEFQPGISIDIIEDIEAEKIRNKQEELFNKAVKELLSIWKNTYSDRYGKSKLKAQFRKKELLRRESILFGMNTNSLPGDPIIAGELTFERLNYLAIREYIDDIIIGGKKDKFYFIHSPNYKNIIQNTIQPQIYARTLWDYYEWLKEHKRINKSSTRYKVLSEIWVGYDRINTSDYEKIISLLKQEYPELGTPFITEKDGNLFWTQNPRKGWVQYLAGFIYTCIQNEWIKNKYSSRQLKEILCRTFNVDFDPKPFKSIYKNPPAEEYLIPFKKIPKKGFT